MATIIGISGSLRKGSYNTALLRAAADMATEVKIEIAPLDVIPLYNGDVEAQGIPSAVAALQKKLTGSSGILIATPEYNNGVPGVLKNAIDWLTRPPRIIASVFAGKPLAMMGATTGTFGTLNAQTAWLTTWRALHVRLWHAKMPFMVSRAQNVFDDDGRITDEAIRDDLNTYVNDFIRFVLTIKHPDV